MGRLRARALELDRRYRAHWDSHAAAGAGDGPVWAVLGDSAAVGLGAPSVAESYVAVVAARLRRELHRPVRVVNLAVSGATAASVREHQLPALAALPRVDAVSCVVGGNDVAWPLRFRAADFRRDVRAIAAALPTPAVMGLVPSFGHWPYEGRVRRANACLRAAAQAYGHDVADIYAVAAGLSWPGRLRLTSPDYFHPNAAGHAAWAEALYPPLRRHLGEAAG